MSRNTVTPCIAVFQEKDETADWEIYNEFIAEYEELGHMKMILHNEVNELKS